MVIVEGDASINTYEDAEGRPKTALNIVQRTSRRPGSLYAVEHANMLIYRQHRGLAPPDSARH